MHAFKPVLFGILVVLAGFGCQAQRDVATRVVPPERARMMDADAASFHRGITLQVGWRNYRESETVRNEDGSLSIETSDSTGVAPSIMIVDPLTEEPLWLSMGMDDALFGRLIKHSLMTQVPIYRPFETYMEEASCSRCHPGDKIPLGDWWRGGER
ncbi:MAG: hypothetical protein HKN29_03225 [Rhodothermales bacterium]|nr:hypothetical protein [Rhodothermales bacterium]